MTANDILRMMEEEYNRYPFTTDKDGMTTWHHSFICSVSRITVNGKEVFSR